MKWCGWLSAAAILVHPLTTLALPKKVQKETHFLRLDETPELNLLRSYRWPQGDGGSHYEHYLRGSFGRWFQRQLYTLDWPENPAIESYYPNQDPCLERLASPLLGFPHTRQPYHFLYAGYDSRLELSDNLLAPWLKRVDPHLASWLLSTSGCRRFRCYGVASFPGENFLALWNQLVPRSFPIPEWKCRERPVRVMSMGNEQKSLVLISCDGSLSLHTLQQVSSLARIKSVKPAQDPWPLEPAAEQPGEWLPGIRLLHPRLLWLLHTIADTYRWRAVYIYSGYRRKPGKKPGSHRSMHHVGRALDIQVQGVANKHVFRACNRQPDTGCGYYPNGKFVHVDVRPKGSGRAVWVDSSGPGQPSRYVSSWPGVYENGRVVSALRPPAKAAGE